MSAGPGHSPRVLGFGDNVIDGNVISVIGPGRQNGGRLRSRAELGHFGQFRPKSRGNLVHYLVHFRVE